MTSVPPEGESELDLRFVTRNVTPAEAAAVTAVLVAAVREGEPAASTPPRSEWSHPRHALRPQVDVGPGRWANSARCR